MKIYLKIIILLTIFMTIKSRNKKKIDVSFSLYRSLCCLFIFIYALQNFLKNGKKGIDKPFEFSNFETRDLTEWFEAYILVDIVIMTWVKCKRIDLWIHHIICLVTILIANKYAKKIPFILNIALLSELMSIVSGIDSVFTDQQDNIRSMYCKKIRKNIINYWRTPLWGLTLVLSIISLKEKKLWQAVL